MDSGWGGSGYPFWRTPRESCKGLGSVTLKINTQHTRPFLFPTHHWRSSIILHGEDLVLLVAAALGSLGRGGPAECTSTDSRSAASRISSRWARDGENCGKVVGDRQDDAVQSQGSVLPETPQ